MININAPEELYKNILTNILENGNLKQNRTGTDTFSIFNTSWNSGELLENGYFPLMTCRKYFFKGALVELFWILGILQKQNPIKGVSNTNIKYLNREGIKYWDLWADKNGELGPVYGAQLVSWLNGSKQINQIQNIVDKLRVTPDDRRLVFSMWNPAELDRMKLPPCHWGGEFYSEPLKDGKRKLHLRWIQRSSDFPVGVPYDIAIYSLLLIMISKMTNHIPGTATGLFGDSHIYKNQVDGVKEMLDSEIKSPPKLNYSGPDYVENLTDFQLSWFNIEMYNPSKTIKLPVSI